MKNKCRVALVGTGKRSRLFYGPIISAMSDEFEFIGVTSRTANSRNKFANDFNVTAFDSIEALSRENIDFVICCVNPESVYKVAEECCKFNLPIMIETPVENQETITLSQKPKSKISVSEQWPHLPLEKFKKKVIDTGLIGDVYLVENDSRLFDYHGIAILRNYLNNQSFPIKTVAMNHTEQIPGLVNENNAHDSWDIGIVKMSTGETLIHKFSYQCKKYDHRGLQSVRAIGSLGCLVNMSINTKNNDFEKIHLSANIDGKICNYKVSINRDQEKNITHQISASFNEHTIVWKNNLNEKYEHDFDDHSYAIGDLLLQMKKAVNKEIFTPPYSVLDGYVDSLIIHSIKNAAFNDTVVKFINN